MAVCQAGRYRGLAVLVRSYKFIRLLRSSGIRCYQAHRRIIGGLFWSRHDFPAH